MDERGNVVARPRKPVDASEIVRLRQEGLSWPAIARRTRLSVGTVYQAHRKASDAPQPFKNLSKTILQTTPNDHPDNPAAQVHLDPEPAHGAANRESPGNLTPSFRNLASRFGTSTAALQRHRKAHLSKAIAKAKEARESASVELVKAKEATEVQEAGTLYEQLRGIGRDTREILEKAKAANDNELALKAIARVEKQLELLARLLGELDESAKIAVGVQVNAAPSDASWEQDKADPPVPRRTMRAFVVEIPGNSYGVDAMRH
jgi:hypothetical protein